MSGGHWWGGNPHSVEPPGHFPEDCKPERIAGDITGAYQNLIDRIRRGNLHILVHPYRVMGKWQAFVWLLTDTGRERIPARLLSPLVRDGLVRVKHVFSNGELLYEAVG